MADPMVADQIPPNPNFSNDFEGLAIPPLDPTFFPEDLSLSDNFISFGDDVEDFDFNFDDICLPSDTGNFLDSTATGLKPILSSDPESGSSNKGVSETELYDASADQSFSAARVSVSRSPESGHVSDTGTLDVAGYLNVSSPNCSGLNQECSQESGCKGSKVPNFLNCSSPESGNPEVSEPASSQGSGNFHSAGSEALSYPSPDSGARSRSADSSHNSANNLRNDVINEKIKLEESGKNCLTKRKKENEDVNSELRTNKYRRSNAVENVDESNVLNSTNDEEEKRKARLMRNRESAQLSRQRKKHYVEELEDKVRAMHSTIQDLNAKISFVVAENATLRQQLSGGAVCPPQVPPPGMYPYPHMAPMGYPWMPCPPYVVKPQGSQVPLVPIPRLKPQQPVSTTKTKKVESKKTDGKTKKVASVSLLGLLFFMLLFGGLVPMVKVNYGRMRVPFSGGSDYTENHIHGRVLTVNGTNHNNIGIGFSNEKFGGGRDFKDSSHSNDSEPLVASLYVPRNDKLVKIDGNLIIHSVLASEKAMASRDEPKMKSKEQTGLAVALAPSISVPRRQHHSYRALPSSSGGKDDLESPVGDGKLQQWFREGLAGPLLSSGMCTEVFQFDASPAPGSIIPATPVHNISAEEHSKNSTHLNKMKNRRILHGLPIPLPGTMSHNITNERAGHKESPHRNNNSLSSSSSSSMVVSVLVDPREAGDTDGVMGPKSLSRIFVVVLLDSVKYVTYSCVLPLMGSSPHLVTT